MTNTQQVLRGSFLMGLIALASACVVAEPREGYYDHDHHRYWQEHTWHECGDHDDRCR
ncbi:MAG TPA: hypothetical protein VGE92_03230 [Steroidobacteraceae bacterium]|jgi:hypothetical protein